MGNWLRRARHPASGVPRLPSSARTASQSAPNSMRVKSSQLIKSCGTRTDLAAETRSIGLPVDAQLSWFLQRHLDSFIVTGQLRTIYRDSAVKTVPARRENPRPSTGTLQKLMPALTLRCAQGRLRRQLPIPPGRYI
jgi:hypothetical protein